MSEEPGIASAPTEAPTQEAPAQEAPPAAEPAAAPAAEPSAAPKQRASDILKESLDAARGAAKAPPSEPPSEEQPPSERSPSERPLKTKFSLQRGDEPVELTPELADLTAIFKAGGQEERRSLDELVRLAQNAAPLTKEVEQLRQERQELYESYVEREREREALASDRETFLKLLRDESGEAFKKVQKAFLERVGNGQAPAEAQPQLSPEEMEIQKQLPPGLTVDHVRSGATIIEQHMKPWASQMAESYGADSDELLATALTLVGEEPPQFLTPEKLGRILNEKLPALLEEHGYTSEAEWQPFDLGVLQAAPAQPEGRRLPLSKRQADEAARLREENEKLKAQLQRKAVEKAPPGAPSGSTPAPRGESLIDEKKLNSAADVRKELQRLQRSGRA